jgi:hypothetical protein
MRAWTMMALTGAVLWPSLASAEVKVNFVTPERYFDASLNGNYGSRRYAAAVKALDAIFQDLAKRYLAPGDQLSIDVLDVDLAGEYNPWTPYSYNVRLMTDSTWPRIKLGYVLTRADGPPVTGVELVSDPNYLTHQDFRARTGALAYEKIMLEAWFKARFVPPKPPAQG